MINLKQFCSKNDPYFPDEDMQEPFSDEKYTYAAAASYIIRVPLVEKYKGNRNNFYLTKIRFPDPDDRTDQNPYIRVPNFRIPDQICCETCWGKGTVDLCPDCEEGLIIFKKGY